MPNIISSVGYSNEKIHTGLLYYLCSLWNEGIKEPFDSFCNKLGIDLNYKKLKPCREDQNIDLVIYDENDMPLIVIEMKVDSPERKSQTGSHKQKIPNANHYLYITLGIGEYFHHKLSSEEFTWVKIDEFYNAILSIKFKDKFISDYKEAIEQEILFQKKVFGNIITKEPRAGTWNIYQLGYLKEELLRKEMKNLKKLKIDPKVYTYGQKPDTIFNFGEERESVYAEINNNGLLNVKINLENEKDTEKEKFFKKEQTRIQNELKKCSNQIKINDTTNYQKSKTLISIDVGIKKEEGYFIITNRQKVVEQLLEPLRIIYGMN